MKHIVLLNWPYRRWWRNRSWCKMPEVILNEGEWSHNEWRVGCLRAGEKEKACSERRCIFKLFDPWHLRSNLRGFGVFIFGDKLLISWKWGRKALGIHALKPFFDSLSFIPTSTKSSVLSLKHYWHHIQIPIQMGLPDLNGFNRFLPVDFLMDQTFLKAYMNYQNQFQPRNYNNYKIGWYL